MTFKNHGLFGFTFATIVLALICFQNCSGGMNASETGSQGDEQLSANKLGYQSQYWWVVGPWSGCSTSCGEGKETRTVLCEDSKNNIYPNSFCSNIPEPSTSESCKGTGPCSGPTPPPNAPPPSPPPLATGVKCNLNETTYNLFRYCSNSSRSSTLLIQLGSSLTLDECASKCAAQGSGTSCEFQNGDCFSCPAKTILAGQLVDLHVLTYPPPPPSVYYGSCL